MFHTNRDAVDSFSVDFTPTSSIINDEQYPLGYFAAEALEIPYRLILRIEDAAKEFAEEAQMFFAARDPSSAGIANEAYLRLWRLLRELPLYNILLSNTIEPFHFFSSYEGFREMWDEMMTKGTHSNINFTHWLTQICRLGEDLNEFERNTTWMLSTYFDELPSHKREYYADAFGRFSQSIWEMVHIGTDYGDDEEDYPTLDPDPASFQFEYPVSISFVARRNEHTGKAEIIEKMTFKSLVSFFYMDLTKGIAAGNLPRICKNCGHWFVAVGGHHTMYCDRLIPGKPGKTCRNIGAHETAKKKLNEAAAREYARTYNRLKGRKRRGVISTDEWNRTVAVAQNLRADFLDGKITETEYFRKLKAL